MALRRKEANRRGDPVYGGKALWWFVLNVCIDLRTYFQTKYGATDEDFFIEEVVPKLYGITSDHIHDLVTRCRLLKTNNRASFLEVTGTLMQLRL